MASQSGDKLLRGMTPSTGIVAASVAVDRVEVNSRIVHLLEDNSAQDCSNDLLESSVVASSNGPVVEESDSNAAAQKELSNEVEDIPKIRTEFVPDDEPEEVTIGLRLQRSICNGRKTDENFDDSRNRNYEVLDEVRWFIVYVLNY